MMVEPLIIQFFLGVISSVSLLVWGFVIRTLNKQNDILIVLSQQVGTMNYPLLNKRVLDLEEDMVRVWAWKEAENQLTGGK